MAPSVAPSYGGGTPATAFNNKFFQVLFALIGAGMVIGSIWFFFWAKNGGFKWRKGDWEDYKSTVLRRKGPDGKTLSNATKSTKLGGGSIVAGQSEYTDETGSSYTDLKETRDIEMGMRGGGAGNHGRHERRERHRDPELREYRHEKVARVGGLNRQHDGSHFDYSNTDRSEVSTRPLTNAAPKDKKSEKKDRQRREKEQKAARKQEAKDAKARAKETQKKQKASASPPKKADPTTTRPHRSAPSAAYSFATGDDTATAITNPYTETPTSYAGGYTAPSQHQPTSSYYTSYRPHATTNPIPAAPPAQASRSHNSTPRSHHRPSHDHEARHQHRTHRDSPSHSRQSSPRKRHHHQRHESRSRPGSDMSRSYADSNSDVGTKAYPCHIPGLSGPTFGSSGGDGIGPGDSVSQVGAPSGYGAGNGGRGNNGGRRGRDVMDGYRRGGKGRRHSLSDSE